MLILSNIFPPRQIRCLVRLQKGVVVGAGEPKSVNYRALIDAASSSSGTSRENENDAPQVPNTTAAAVGCLVFDEDF